VNSVFAQLPATRIQEILNTEVANRRTPGVIVGIIDASGKRLVLSAGVQSEQHPVKPDINTMYEIGSVTKVFTSLLLADMSSKQEINLHDPISKFLPDTVQAPTWKGKEITLLNLSSHATGGFPRMPDNYAALDESNPFADYTINQLYDYISRFKLVNEPGTQFAYSNSGYGLLGHILSERAGLDYEALVKERICKQLGLKNTTVVLTAAQLEHLATGHNEYGHVVHNWDLPAMAGTGALRSNMDDMLTFAAANLGLIQTPLWPAMQLSHIPRVFKGKYDGEVTMGWTAFEDKGHQFLWKDGTTGGYRSLVLLDVGRKTGIVIFSNSLNPVNDMAYHMLDAQQYPLRPYKYKWALLDTMNTTIRSLGVDAAIMLYDKLKAAGDTSFVFDEMQLNYVGNDLRLAGQMKDAVKIHQLNVKAYPSSPMVYESLGETYRRNGNKALAIENYEKSLSLQADNPRVIWILGRLRNDTIR
jgi:CubicO group peptidase (beta-lactamase class C family)